MPRRRGAQEVQRITTAPVGQRQHQQQQIGKYLVSMGVRTACIILLIVVPSPWRWIFVPLAVVLPYIAVLVANAGRETVRPTTTQVTPVAQPALGRAAPEEPSVEEPLVGDVRGPDDPATAEDADVAPSTPGSWRGAA